MATLRPRLKARIFREGIETEAVLIDVGHRDGPRSAVRIVGLQQAEQCLRERASVPAYGCRRDAPRVSDLPRSRCRWSAGCSDGHERRAGSRDGYRRLSFTGVM